MKCLGILVLSLLSLSANGFFLSAKETKWNGLKVSWGMIWSSSAFVSMPRTVDEALEKGWKLDKSCGQINGNRYVLNNDRAVMLVFGADGRIAGLSTGIPKNLPFNFPSQQQRKYFNDEGDFYSISAYFKDPKNLCNNQRSIETGDRLVIKSDQVELSVSLEEKDLDMSFWTMGKCFYTMGQHYWANLNGTKIDSNTQKESFFPAFLLYNKGKLNGFGWAFNADLPSQRYEHPPKLALSKFFTDSPKFFNDPNQSQNLSTLHIYLDNTPHLNYC